jgi:hypothetical protein
MGLCFNKSFFFLLIISNMSGVFDLGELVKRTIKYLVEGIMVAIAAYAIPKRSLAFDEVALIALTAAATFSIHTFQASLFLPEPALDSVSALTSSDSPLLSVCK